MKGLVNKTVLTICLLCLGAVSICLAQDDLNKLLLKQGKVIAEVSAGTASGPIEVTRYRLEQVKLTKPFDLRDNLPPLESVFRLVIVTAKSLAIDDYGIWLDDVQKPAYQIKPNAFAIIIYERSLPDSTIKMAISKRSEKSRDLRSVVSTLLSVPAEYAASPSEMDGNRRIITLRRSSGRVPGVEFIIDNMKPTCSIVGSNNPVVLEIDGNNVGYQCDDNDMLIAWVSNESFNRFRDGAEIAFKFGGGREAGNNRSVVGLLNKRSLEQ